MNKISIGAAAEKSARIYLEQHGLKLMQQHYQCRMGEIDLIMLENTTWVFVEVRYRTSGLGAESVDYFKQRKLLRTAQFYLKQQGMYHTAACRFDVLSLTRTQDKITFNWIKNAFS